MGEEEHHSWVWVLHKLAWVHYNFVGLVEGHILEWVSWEEDHSWALLVLWVFVVGNLSKWTLAFGKLVLVEDHSYSLASLVVHS